MLIKLMRIMFKKYFSVGVINTMLHWTVFYICLSFGMMQSLSNLTAFSIAVTFSFFVNGAYTFNNKVNLYKYVIYVFFMGGMALGIGYFSDVFEISSFFTLVMFSTISLIFGFIFSKFIVFKD